MWKPTTSSGTARNQAARRKPGATTALRNQDPARKQPRKEYDIANTRHPGDELCLVTVRGLLIAVVTVLTAASAGIATGFMAHATGAELGGTATTVAAIAAGLAVTVTTALAVASGLNRLIKRE